MNWLRGLRGEQAGENPQGVSADPAATASIEPVRVAPEPDDPPEVWAEAACHATDKALAGEWAARVQTDALLAEIAIRSRFAEVRLAAVRRISEHAVLKQVADASREKDKHVYRHCSDALKAHRQEDRRAQRAVDFEAALHALLDVTPIAISHLLQIEKDLAALGKGGEETATCEALLEQARARVLDETRTQIDLRSRLTEAEALRSTIPLPEAPEVVIPEAAALAAWRGQSEEIAQIAATGPAWLATLPAARALARTLEEIDARLSAFAQAIAHAEQEKAETEAQLLRAAEAASRKAEQDAQAALDATARSVGGKAARKNFDQEAVQRLVTELEQHLEEGRTTEAEAAGKQIEHALGGGTLSGQFARRLQRARAQQARLTGWARWGTDRAREQLIGVAEALLRAEPDIDERARAVPLLRREWRDLDAHGPASQSAWKRFDRALEKAYKPVAELRAVEAAAHAAARAARDALCESWEIWIAAAIVAPDFKALEAKRDEIIAAWRSAPKAGYRDERQLRKRLDAVLASIDGPLDAARAEELARREALVAAAQAALEELDLAKALSAAKTLQRRWKDEAPGLRLRQGPEQKLWQRFRKACDAVFARRESEQAAQMAERAAREEARQAELQAANAIEAQKKEKHAARFARMAEQSSAAAQEVAAEALELGHAQREVMLLDLEIALDLPTPETHAAARRTRMLARLQDRFRSGTPAQEDPEVLVKKWYALAARPDEAQSARISTIVQKILAKPEPVAATSQRFAEPRPVRSRSDRTRPDGARPNQARRDSRS